MVNTHKKKTKSDFGELRRSEKADRMREGFHLCQDIEGDEDASFTLVLFAPKVTTLFDDFVHVGITLQPSIDRNISVRLVGNFLTMSSQHYISKKLQALVRISTSLRSFKRKTGVTYTNLYISGFCIPTCRPDGLALCISLIPVSK